MSLALVAGACSDDAAAGKAEPKSDVTTITLSLNGKPIDLSAAKLKCYQFEGHLSVEALNRADPDSTHFLMDYFNNGVSLSIQVKGMDPDLYDYAEGENGQHSTVTHDGNAVTVEGTIAAAGDSSDAPKPFSIKANCGQFFNTPPDAASVG